jgi:hypothetical protein
MATTIERAVWLMKAIADGNYGYSQPNRWGEYGKEPSDFDCSSSVTYSWQSAGVPVRDAGASTTSNMYKPFLACGFKDVTSQIDLKTGKGLRAGDVLLYPYDGKYGHTEMMITDKLICGARRDENGKDGWESGGAKPGDQTGAEIEYGPYYNFATGWKYVLRYTAEDGEADRFEAILTSTKGTIVWSTGAGPKTRNCPYIEVTRKELGFTPKTICVQHISEPLDNAQWMRGLSHLYCTNHENNAYAGIAVGKAVSYFDPDADPIRIPVWSADQQYYVRIFA